MLPVGLSVGMSTEPDPSLWAMEIINSVEDAHTAMKKKVPNLNVLSLKAMQKHYCASAFYARFVLNWTPVAKNAGSFNVAGLGRHTGYCLKGFYRRLTNAIFVTASVDEQEQLSLVEHDLIQNAQVIGDNLVITIEMKFI